MKKVNYKEEVIKMINNLISKYESEGDYYMNENDEPQLRTHFAVIRDLEKIKNEINKTK
jgi:hypothetical protein